MKKIYFHSLLLAIYTVLFVSCSPSAHEVVYKDAAVTVVYDDITTDFPGEVFVSDNYLIWTDPFGEEEQAHIIDKKSYKEIGKCVRRGQAPGEFSMATYCVADNDLLLVGDINKNQLHTYSMDNLKLGRPALLKQEEKETVRKMPLIAVTPEDLLAFDPMNAQSFLYKGKHFGKPLFEEEIENLFDVVQGTLAYQPDKGLLLYAPFNINYMAAYQKKGDNFELLWEKRGEQTYRQTGNKIKPDMTKMNMAQVVWTKDYIVTLQRDYKTDPVDESTIGRDETKLPKTIFVYDYEGNLLQIQDLKIPTLRIGATPGGNDVYAIVVNPEFCLAKVEL